MSEDVRGQVSLWEPDTCGRRHIIVRGMTVVCTMPAGHGDLPWHNDGRQAVAWMDEKDIEDIRRGR